MLKEENLVLYLIQKSVSRNLRSCDYMSSISNSYDIFAAELDRQLLHKIPLHSVRNVVHRLSHTEAYLHYLQRMLQTQSSMLHNLILQDDTKVSQQIADTSKRISEAALTETTAMKTIAYLMLAFLPVTFVSSIFSTTIFNFQNWNSKDAFKVTSDGWWIYVLSCLLATTATLSVYFYWNQHQRKSSVKRSLDLELNS
ncbi:hypothetical protein B0J14DRAFT_605138 [Halenospora varia]|nr:hypothetical protein B0J14DRAFT_605138 [Halenospora varia]